MPVNHNGLGYNNLIQIFNIIKFRLDMDYNILLIEEPEAHLHPAMQYKLFKYLSSLNEVKIQKDGTEEEETNNSRIIKNQIFVTTHSPNISAAANIDDMISLKYHRDERNNDYKVVAENLKNKFDKPEYKNSKRHLAKFLDVTRSDMLFAYKVILVEGLAEKLLLPAFAKKCGLDYELETNHISIVEVGGINFKHFLPVFEQESNKVLCIRDCDYKYIQDEGQLRELENYKKHIKELKFIKPEMVEDKDEAGNMTKKEVDIEKLFNPKYVEFITQKNYGSTFENELFIDNFNNGNIAKELLKLVAPNNLINFIENNVLTIQSWHTKSESIDNANTRKKVQSLMEPYFNAYQIHGEETQKTIEAIFFANLFLSYGEKKKGDLALNILASNLMDELNVPLYIKDGLEWLQK